MFKSKILIIYRETLQLLQYVAINFRSVLCCEIYQAQLYKDGKKPDHTNVIK